jgi:hypothetical protein
MVTLSLGAVRGSDLCPTLLSSLGLGVSCGLRELRAVKNKIDRTQHMVTEREALQLIRQRGTRSTVHVFPSTLLDGAQLR